MSLEYCTSLRARVRLSAGSMIFATSDNRGCALRSSAWWPSRNIECSFWDWREETVWRKTSSRCASVSLQVMIDAGTSAITFAHSDSFSAMKGSKKLIDSSSVSSKISSSKSASIFRVISSKFAVFRVIEELSGEVTRNESRWSPNVGIKLSKSFVSRSNWVSFERASGTWWTHPGRYITLLSNSERRSCHCMSLPVGSVKVSSWRSPS